MSGIAAGPLAQPFLRAQTPRPAQRAFLCPVLATTVLLLLLALCCYWVVRQLDPIAPPRWLRLAVGVVAGLVTSAMGLLLWLY